MHVHKNVKSTKKWNIASSALKHAEVVLKNAAKWWINTQFYPLHYLLMVRQLTLHSMV
jgi:hypothetical protein